MIIKTFRAESTALALKSVRAEMGGDAVVLKTRQLPDGSGQVEITACLDKPTASQASAVLTGPMTSKSETASRMPTTTDAGYSPTFEVGGEIERRLDLIDRKIDRLMSARFESGIGSPDAAKMHRGMIEAGVTEKIASEILSEATIDNTTDVAGRVRTNLIARIEAVLAGEVKFELGDKVLFYGPAGSGKTSLLGRVAAGLVVDDQKKVKLLSLDNCKVGGVEEIYSYGDLLSTEVIDSAPDENDKQSASEIILVDSPSITYGGTRYEMVRKQLDGLKPSYRLLVCSAMHNFEDNVRFMHRTEAIEPTHLVVTMLDMTEKWGSVLSLCEEFSLKIMLVTDSPGGIGMARTPDAEKLADKIINTEDSNVQS